MNQPPGKNERAAVGRLFCGRWGGGLRHLTLDRLSQRHLGSRISCRASSACGAEPLTTALRSDSDAASRSSPMARSKAITVWTRPAAHPPSSRVRRPRRGPGPAPLRRNHVSQRRRVEAGAQPPGSIHPCLLSAPGIAAPMLDEVLKRQLLLLGRHRCRRRARKQPLKRAHRSRRCRRIAECPSHGRLARLAEIARHVVRRFQAPQGGAASHWPYFDEARRTSTARYFLCRLCGSAHQVVVVGLVGHFLSCLCPSARSRQYSLVCEPFLSCLCGSARRCILRVRLGVFLSCLCGSARCWRR